jgi:hypothetical protein
MLVKQSEDFNKIASTQEIVFLYCPDELQNTKLYNGG